MRNNENVHETTRPFTKIAKVYLIEFTFGFRAPHSLGILVVVCSVEGVGIHSISEGGVSVSICAGRGAIGGICEENELFGHI